jgi:hypothetical protein
MEDYNNLPGYVKEGLTRHSVSNYIDVYKVAFPATDGGKGPKKGTSR